MAEIILYVTKFVFMAKNPIESVISKVISEIYHTKLKGFF
jgi:hypothetical protein